jgi:hypothetical protein
MRSIVMLHAIYPHTAPAGASTGSVSAGPGAWPARMHDSAQIEL